jgi:tight adherence protein C
MDTFLLLIALNAGVLAVMALAVWLFIPSAVSVNGQAPAIPEELPGVGPVILGGFKSLAETLSSAGSGQSLQRRLDVVGNPRRWNVERVFVAKGMGAVGFGVLSALFAAGWAGSILSFKALMVVAGATFVGFFLPNVLIYNAGLKRQQRIQQDLPDVLDLMTVSMRAGLGFDAAVMRVATNGSGPLSLEFARLLQEFRLGVSRIDALRKMAGRSTVEDLNHVVQSLAQADSLGIPVADVLMQQGREMRLKRRQRAEEKAQKVTVKILFPTLLCIFPALLVVVGGPAAITIAEMFS